MKKKVIGMSYLNLKGMIKLPFTFIAAALKSNVFMYCPIWYLSKEYHSDIEINFAATHARGSQP